MNLTSTLRRFARCPLGLRVALTAALASLLCLTPLSAQTGNTGAVTGTVANSGTNQFLANAEVRVAGTNQVVLTDRDGSFELRNLAPGTYELQVTYAGLDPEKRSVTVTAGSTRREEFNLTTGVYKMAAFTVASEVEGNAAQVNKQKKADFFVTAVSADTLGEVPEGNIGEFLKYVPGLQVNYVNADASTVSVRGQDPEATTFMIDGMVPPAAGTPPRSSTGSSDASSRAFEFTQASIANIESIEVFKAPPPWMAPSTGGVINAETKNAFAQKRRVLRTVLSLNANSDMLRLGYVEGPGQRSTSRLKPAGSLAYSEAFLNNTLGVTFTYGESHLINPTHNNAMGYTLITGGTTAAPATDASPVRVDTFTLVDGPEVKHRRSASLTVDYKLGQNTTLKAGFSYNNFLRQSRQHTYRLRPISGATGSTVVAGATDRDATILNGQVDIFADYSDASSQNYNFTGMITHRWGRFRFDGTAAYGKSDSKTTDLPGFINSVQFNLLPNRGVGYHIQASPDLPAPTALTQVAGPDWFDLASYDQRSLSVQTQPRFQNDRTINLRGDVRASFAEWRFPVEFRTGASFYHMARRKAAGQIVLDFRGPDGVVGNDDFLNATRFADTTYGDRFLYGIRTPPLLDPYKVGVYMRENPLAFQDIQPTNVQRQAVNSQNLTQDITAVYFADTVRFNSRLSLLTGIRGEKTENFARGALRQNSLGVGLPSNSKAFFQAVYSQTQRVTSNYTDWFPQAQATYRFTPDAVLRASISKSMSRPGIQTILPNTTVNDTVTPVTISVNNNALTPQYSTNIDLAFEYYTQQAGKFTFGWFDKRIKDYILTSQTILGPDTDTGFEDDFAPGTVVNTQSNGGNGRFQGVELSVSQPLQPYLNRLPPVLRGWDVFGNYTKNYKGEAPNRNGVITVPTAPNFYAWNANYGVGYHTPGGKLYAQVRTVIYPRAVQAYANGTTDLRNTYEDRHQRWDFTLRWRFGRNYAVELTGANIFEDPSRKFIQGNRVIAQRDYGANYVLSFTANLDQLQLPFMKR
jgi:iron complex outermembrane receptor protein